MNANQPEKIFRIGSVSASVFVNTVVRDGKPDQTIRNVSIQKRYVVDGEAKFSSSFGLAELPLAIEVLRLALKHLVRMELDVTPRRDWDPIAEQTFIGRDDQPFAESK